MELRGTSRQIRGSFDLTVQCDLEVIRCFFLKMAPNSEMSARRAKWFEFLDSGVLIELFGGTFDRDSSMRFCGHSV